MKTIATEFHPEAFKKGHSIKPQGIIVQVIKDDKFGGKQGVVVEINKKRTTVEFPSESYNPTPKRQSFKHHNLEIK